MLREILLSLSGLPSPIWDDLSVSGDSDDATSSFKSYTSPAERQILASLGELARLHRQLRDKADTVSKTANPPACRAVSNRIASAHLRAFMSKIVEVEAAVLKNDARFVGAYKIVPLSTLVTEFQPWLRPFRWMSKTLKAMQEYAGHVPYTTAELLDYLQKESQTGYLDIKEIAVDLLVAGEKAWLQSITPWLLHGRLPSFGASDFMIQPAKDQSDFGYCVQDNLRPFFVSNEASEIILAIGKALVQITPGSWSTEADSHVSCSTIMPQALRNLKSLAFPLQASELLKAAYAIDENISRTALRHLLSTDLILDLMKIIQDYVLLQNGEFGTCLISHAERRQYIQHSLDSTLESAPKLRRLDSFAISAADLSNILSRTWSDLAVASSEHESNKHLREKAAQWLRFRMVQCALPINTCVSAQAGVLLDFPPDSPLSLFVSSSDRQRYCQLTAYLISVHRARTNLAGLWTVSGCRRALHPATRVNYRARRNGSQDVVAARNREDARHKLMRSSWACASLVIYLLSEISSYIHGEVIEKSWTQFNTWLSTRITNRPSFSSMKSRPSTCSESDSTNSFSQEFASADSRVDPRIIAVAHHTYLDALYENMLLGNEEYVLIMRELLHTIDHYVALFQRLHSVWQSQDPHNGQYFANVSSSARQEEVQVFNEMTKSSRTLREQVDELVTTIRDADQQRDWRSMTARLVGTSIHSDAEASFEPWRARSLERLLMKLDSLGPTGSEDEFKDALIDLQEDD